MLATVDKHESETAYMDRVLVGWARWARTRTINLWPVSAGKLWGIPTVLELEDVMELTDEQFGVVDKAVAMLKGSRLYQVVEIEYRQSCGSDERNARHLGLSRTAYRAERNAALWTLHTLLRQHIERWGQR